MKLPLATGVLSSIPPPAPMICVLRVDRVFDRVEQPRFTHDELPDTSYRAVANEDRWEVTVDGETVTLVQKEHKLRGRESSNVFGERRFDLIEGAMAGGRFVMRGEEAELTIFGSGVTIASSERGKLVSR